MGKIYKLIKAASKATKDEVNEIKSLTITDEDKKAAKAVATLAVSALSAYGIPAGIAKEPLEIILQYTIRDLRDGVKDTNKLYIKRIIQEVKKDK